MAWKACVLAFLILAINLEGAQAAFKLQRPLARQCPSCGGHDDAPPPGQFNFYFLVRQWPFEFCHGKTCSVQPDPAEGFTLHGLWPNLDNECPDDYPEKCSDDEFDPSALNGDTYSDMKEVWPSYTTDNKCFWSHEWSCHGSCSGLSQEDYFSGTVKLHKQYDIAAALAKHNITPSSQPYDKSDFESALASEFGAAPLLFCTGGEYIDQIFSCVDESLNLVDCSSVCVVHDCTPQGREACRNSIIYKISPVRTGPPSACKDKFRVCKEKSGTCVPP